jgi:peptide-methionine (S)-S-oxide reductase
MGFFSRTTLTDDDPRWLSEPAGDTVAARADAPAGLQTATFGAGCFWGVEIEFANLPGVRRTAVGYLGGTLSEPTYEEVCTGRTGHAEVVQVDFDPSEVSYEQLVERFFALHDPTQRNRQGPDVGTQYRSAIFFHDAEQERVAREVRDRAQAGFDRPIATEIAPASAFYRAEDYHQRYLEKRGLASCAVPATTG